MEDRPTFLQHWFKGFEKSMACMPEADRNAVWKACGRACSDSYTKQIYLETYAHAKNINDFCARLKERFPEMDISLSGDGAYVQLTYRYCACDLVRDGYMSTPLLCECSRQSLLYNWEAVLGEQNVEVELLQSILGGGDCCRFLIRIYSK